MNLSTVVATMLNPALAWLVKQPGGARMDSPAARVMLLAIGLQESRFLYRRQFGNGPANSFWQFERGTKASRGGVWGIYLHPATAALLQAACNWRKVTFTPEAIHLAIINDDVLACICARLLLWSDAKPLPLVGDELGGWDCYALRTWRPGKPHRDTWAGFYADAVDQVTA